MEWTKDKPTVSGNYWYWNTRNNIVRIVWVDIGDGASWVEAVYDDSLRLEDCNDYWYGPIEPPALPDASPMGEYTPNPQFELVDDDNKHDWEMPIG